MLVAAGDFIITRFDCILEIFLNYELAHNTAHFMMLVDDSFAIICHCATNQCVVKVH